MFFDCRPATLVMPSWIGYVYTGPAFLHAPLAFFVNAFLVSPRIRCRWPLMSRGQDLYRAAPQRLHSNHALFVSFLTSSRERVCAARERARARRGGVRELPFPRSPAAVC